MKGLHLEIVTPDKVVLSEQVDYVGAPGVDGEFGILAGHIPLLSALKIGGLYYKQNGKTYWAFLSGGFTQVADDKVTILAESAELSEHIDIARAESARKRAEAYIHSPKPDTDMMRAQVALERAILRIRVSSSR